MSRFNSLSATEVPDALRRVAGLQGGAPVAIACIGSRDLNQEQLNLCRTIGRWIASAGLFVVSGNAPGADQAYQAGAAEVNPTFVVVYLPWASFEKAALRPGYRVRRPPYPEWASDAAAVAHPRWTSLTEPQRLLHTRNMMIVAPATLCFAWPSAKPWGGGTGTGIRRANQLNIPVIDLSIPEVRHAVASVIGFSIENIEP